MSKDKPLDAVAKAHEEEYFRRRNAELIEALRRRIKIEAEARELSEATGVHDEVILRHVAELGINHHQVPVLHLVPLIEVAWADGVIHPDERELLEHVAAQAGLVGPALELFEQLLTTRPTQGYFDAALEFVRAMLVAHDDDVSLEAVENLTELAYRVADAAGGVWNLWNRVEEKEKEVLRHIAERLADKRPDAANGLLSKL